MGATDYIDFGIITVGRLIELAAKLRELFGSDVEVTQEMIDEAIAAIPPKLEIVEEQ